LHLPKRRKRRDGREGDLTDGGKGGVSHTLKRREIALSSAEMEGKHLKRHCYWVIKVEGKRKIVKEDPG